MLVVLVGAFTTTTTIDNEERRHIDDNNDNERARAHTPMQIRLFSHKYGIYVLCLLLFEHLTVTIPEVISVIMSFVFRLLIDRAAERERQKEREIERGTMVDSRIKTLILKLNDDDGDCWLTGGVRLDRLSRMPFFFHNFVTFDSTFVAIDI